MQAKARRDALDEAIAELAGEPPFAEIVGRLCCLRGVGTLTALALTVELGDWTRFRPQALGPFLGLTPSEDSSGERRRLGAITKTGNTHARRLLVEAAWQQRRPLRESATLDAPPARAARRGPRPRRPERPPAAPALARARAARQAAHGRRGRRRARARRPLLGARDDVAATSTRLGEESAAAQRTRGATRGTATSRPTGRRSTLESGTASSARTPGHAVPTRAYQPRHNASTTAAALSPPKQEGPHTRAFKPCRLDKSHSISAVGPRAGWIC